MEIKFTTDGRKVVVIGNLNAQEKIVQEVFIVNNIEVPSGENFVVKSLHDAPAISWKESEVKKMDAIYEKQKLAHDQRMDDLNKRLRKNREELESKLLYVGKVLKEVSEDSFNMISDYLCGHIKYVVVDSYSAPEIIEIDKFQETREDSFYSDRRLRLISIYGNDNGSLTFKQGQYSDGSGSDICTFHPFKDYESALEKFKEIILTKAISDSLIVLAKTHGVTLDSEKLEEYKDNKRKNYQSNIERYSKDLETFKKALEDVDSI